MIIKKDEELWVTNISMAQDIMISDLRIKIPRGRSLNLLAKRKNGNSLYAFTRDDIMKSISSGSISKNAFLRVRKVPPVLFTNRIDIDESARRPSKNKIKPQEIEHTEYTDLEIDDGSLEDFAYNNADLDFSDRAPILAVDPRFKKSE